MTRVLVILLVGLCIPAACKRSASSKPHVTEYTSIVGATMGTYYKITCHCPTTEGLQGLVDQKLDEINGQVSTYIPTSYISKVNQSSPRVFTDLPDHFKVNLERAKYWYDQSDGYFDVSTQPLVNYWGFGYTPKHAITKADRAALEKLVAVVGLGKWGITVDQLEKTMSGQEIGFAALAKGYAVDEVGRVLAASGCTDYYVDIGGEQVLKGMSARGDKWIVGIATPKYDAAATDTELILQLSDRAIASSGNYRNYHESNGQKYGHTIDPKSGLPYQDSLLAVTIITDACIDADAVATACMAMGYAKAATFIEHLPNISACFLVGDSNGRIATKFKNGFIQYVINQ